MDSKITSGLVYISSALQIVVGGISINICKVFPWLCIDWSKLILKYQIDPSDLIGPPFPDPPPFYIFRVIGFVLVATGLATLVAFYKQQNLSTQIEPQQ
ncbi:hypothetical protein [Coleofasciculus sp.]|uniref:hypothetical protein n=1 Tax=Coleofasciculus sp. TaxID=3100458 RepID=UPI003A33A179